MVVSGLALAETWATLTALPLEPRLTGDQAKEMLVRARKRLAVIAMTDGIYLRAIERCTARGLRSGAIYDALHLVAAESRRARKFLTFDVADFVRLADRDSPEVSAPA